MPIFAVGGLLVGAMAAVQCYLMVLRSQLLWFDSERFDSASEKSQYEGKYLLVVLHALRPMPIAGVRRVMAVGLFALILIADLGFGLVNIHLPAAQATVSSCGQRTACVTVASTPTLSPSPTSTLATPSTSAAVTPTSATTLTGQPTPAPTATFQPTPSPTGGLVSANLNRDLVCECQSTGIAVWVDHATSAGGAVYINGTLTNTGLQDYPDVTCNGSQGVPQLFVPGVTTGKNGTCGADNNFPLIKNDGHPVPFTVTFTGVSLLAGQTYKFHFCLQMNNDLTPTTFTMDFDDIVFTAS